MIKLLFALVLSTIAAVGGAAQDRTTVFLIGDSTMSDKPDPGSNPERGWGQMLPDVLGGSVVVKNHAVNGRSTKSFLDEGRWEAVLGEIRPGDYVFIQFGHNDQKYEDPARYTNPHTGYRRNLEKFVAEARERGANPVLFSSIVRRSFNAHGVLVDTHGAYPVVARAVAREMGVPFVDLQTMSEELVLGYGPDASTELYVWVRPGEFAMYPEGKQDNTHLSVKGATEVARLAVQGLRDAGVPLGNRVTKR